MDFKHDLPNGYSVRITRENDQPAQITVKKGDQTWTIVGEDEEALEELPEDVREHVKRLLENPVQRILGGEMEDLQEQFRNFQLPPMLGDDFRLPRGQGIRKQHDPMVERMEQLERQLRELQQRLEESKVAE